MHAIRKADPVCQHRTAGCCKIRYGAGLACRVGHQAIWTEKSRSAHFDRNGSLFLKLKDLLEFGVHVLVATATAAISADDDTAGVNQDLGGQGMDAIGFGLIC